MDIPLNILELSILKYYKNGGEMCGFENGSPWKSLCDKGFLDGDLELTIKARHFIENFHRWDSILEFKNQTRISIKIEFNTAVEAQP